MTNAFPIRRRPVGAARFLLPALLLFGVACDDSPTSPPSLEDQLRTGHTLLPDGNVAVLEARGDSFQAGGEVELILTNTGSGTLGYNLCGHGLERRTAGGWELLLDEARVCTMVLHTLQPGASAEYPTRLPEHLAAGEYRFRVGLYLMGSNQMRDQVSGAFHLE